jgi:hypothetical protein
MAHMKFTLPVRDYIHQRDKKYLGGRGFCFVFCFVGGKKAVQPLAVLGLRSSKFLATVAIIPRDIATHLHLNRVRSTYCLYPKKRHSP